MPTTTITYDGRQINSSSQSVPVLVTYNENTIASISAATTKTLNCSGKYMSTNISVGGKTLNCANKIMSGNVVITVASQGTTASVTVNGSGNSSYCYATIGGTKRTGSYSGTVNYGSIVTFGIWGGKNVTGTCEINGSTVSSKKNGSATYAWTVPTCDTITISLSYNNNKNNGYGNITVITA